MKPYILINGNTKDVQSFEEKISNAIEQGYEFSGDLIVKKTNDSDFMLFQPMIMEEELEFDEEDLEELEATLDQD